MPTPIKRWKQCRKCGRNFKIDKFYKNAKAKDNRMSWCKFCVQKNSESRNLRLRKKRKRGAKQGSKRGMRVHSVDAYELKYPHRTRANRAARLAVLEGRLVRKDHCEDCGKECDTVMHHPNYSKPLDVVFLCNGCHTRLHNKRR